MPKWRPSLLVSCGCAVALALACTGSVSAAGAAQPVEPRPNLDRPESARRVVAIFDFEEKNPADSEAFNPDPVPRFWFRAQDDPGAAGRPRPGFPAWNAAVFDQSIAASGTTSVRLDASGGSAALRLMPGAIPVFPGADYAIIASARTEGLDRSRAFVTARFLDASRRPIAGAEVRSAPLSTGGAWAPVSLEMRGDHPAAAFLQIDLELLQPREFMPATGAGGASRLGPHAVQLDDVNARAWFDDVSVFLVPRVTLDCDSPANVAVAPDRPTLRFSVRDMVGDALDAALTVRDVDGALVTRHTLSIDPGGRIMTWTPELPALGWYSVSLDVTHAGTPVAGAQTQIVWLPRPLAARPQDNLGPEEARRFGLAADDAPPGMPPWPDFAPHIARAAGTGFIILPHADPTADPADLARELGLAKTALDGLLDLQQVITLSFAAVPDALADSLKIDARDTLALGRLGESAWMPFLIPILDQYGQRIIRWQIGPSNNAGYAAGHPDLAAALANFGAGLSRFVPGPMLAVPWRGDVAPPRLESGADLDAVTLVYPHDAPRSGLAPAIAAWQGSPDAGTPARELTIVLQTPPTESRSRAGLDELVKRAVEFIAAVDGEPPHSPPLRAAVMSPWRWTPAPRAHATPEPQLAVWRTITDHLAGRRVVTELPVSPGVRCIVLADAQSAAGDAPGAADLRPQRGALIAWNDSAAEADAVLHAYLGEGSLTRIDIFGNATPLQRNADAAGTHTIPIPGSPIIIDGIDPRMVRFLASFRVDPPFARAYLTEHEHNLVLENPWPTRISGQLQIVSPDPDTSGWTLSPRGVVTFAIAPGGVERIPMSFSFRANEETGRKTFSILVKLTADRTYPAQLLSAPLDVGSETLDFTAQAARSDDGDGPDLIVTASITNRGRIPRTFRLDATAPGRPTQQLPISDLAPGEQAIRRFVFKDAAVSLAGKRIRVSLADTDAPERLNTTVLAP